MTSLYQTLQTSDDSFGVANFSDLRRYSPAEIRLTIQSLMNDERIDLALALGDAGMSLYPNSEDMLAINGLLAATQQDWGSAIEHLLSLSEIQGERVQPFTYLMLVRCLRCDLEVAFAKDVLRIALEKYPDDPSLKSQAEELASDDGSFFVESKAT